MFDDRALLPVPEWLMGEVLDPVLSDLQRPRPVKFELGVEPRGEGQLVWFRERGESDAAGRRTLIERLGASSCWWSWLIGYRSRCPRRREAHGERRDRSARVIRIRRRRSS